MNKSVKYTVAVVLKPSRDSNEFLVVKRPDDDPDLASSWGFPAVTLQPGELPEAAALRVCREKLGCQATPGRFLGIMFQQRNSYNIFLMDIEMELVAGQSADIHKANTEHTAYADQKWTTDPMDLMPAAQ